MNKKVKVLYFVDRMLRGGIQTFVLENMKYIDKEKVQIDYLLLDDGVTYELEDVLKGMGSNVYKLEGVWIRTLKDYINYYKKMDMFFKNNHDYKVVHMHSSSKNFLVLKLAKKYGIKVRIAHSHNIGFQTNSKAQIILGNILKMPLKRYATHYFACSELAGKWLFGKQSAEQGDIEVIHNAVDLSKFKIDKNIRHRIRKELNIEDKLVIGHVGRFTSQKNHEFLIDIFNEIHKKNSNTVLMLVGTGEREEEIQIKVDNLGLTENVLFMGFKNNINELMWSMDAFVFPSLFEGLGLVLIEAQAAGIKCFTSKTVVPLEAKVSDLLEYISLEDSSQTWADIILKSDLGNKDRYREIKENGYDIKDTAMQLEKFYTK